MPRFVRAASYVFVKPGIPIPPGVVFHDAARSNAPRLGLNENRAPVITPSNSTGTHEIASLRVTEGIKNLDTTTPSFTPDANQGYPPPKCAYSGASEIFSLFRVGSP